MKTFICVSAAGIVAVEGALAPNALGQPQEIKDQVCAGRSSVCSVFLDVPDQCGGAESDCPIGFFFHGHTGFNTGFAHSGAGQGVHAYNFIGVYPQGEIYNGQSGWNDGSLDGNKCAWDDFACQDDPNDGVFVKGIIEALRGMGANGRVYLWGGSNGGNEAQILASNAGEYLPIVGISAGWNQLMSAPPRSGPSPFNFNQPTAPGAVADPARLGDGRAIAQQAHHGDADTTIPYTGGPRFGSRFILYSEPESDEVWKTHNGCPGSLTSSEVPATYRSPQTHAQVQTTAIKWVWGGCPATAPVEYYQIKGAPHGGADTIDGKDAFDIVFKFWTGVEDAHRALGAATLV